MLGWMVVRCNTHFIHAKACYLYSHAFPCEYRMIHDRSLFPRTQHQFYLASASPAQSLPP